MIVLRCDFELELELPEFDSDSCTVSWSTEHSPGSFGQRYSSPELNSANCLLQHLQPDYLLPAHRTDRSGKPHHPISLADALRDGMPAMFRANIKDNIIQVNQFWAQAYGFRANFPIENQKRTKRSDVYDTLSDLINQHGFDGRACILKTFCDASKAITPNSGMLFKMFKLIFSNRRKDFTSGFNSLPKDDDKLYPYLKSNDCEELDSHCPLSLLNLTPYTDV
ncbi:hypothetical protein HA402_007479 [Bradysia odoriphaga]|nr:hypothetical protein HA402_007479 [Bradysia odoriphaga]